MRRLGRLPFIGARAPALAAVFSGIALLSVTACAAAAPEPTATPLPTTAPAPTAPSQAQPVTAPAGPGSEGAAIEPILATRVLNPGEQRVAFLLVGEKAIIKAPEATVSTTYMGEGGETGQEKQATFHGWPFGIRGAYSTQLTFDRSGPWQLMVSVDDGEVSGNTVIDLEVVEDSPVPALGERPPLSRTKTLGDVAEVAQLTTDYNADEDLYRISVKEAVESPRPAVVVFASPAFCTSPTCGPQVDTVKELKAAYQGQADFVHVEIYDLPEEIQGDLSKAQLAPAVEEWGFASLPHWFNESWVFIIDEQGIIRQRFEGYATLTELEEALKETLAGA